MAGVMSSISSFFRFKTIYFYLLGVILGGAISVKDSDFDVFVFIYCIISVFMTEKVYSYCKDYTYESNKILNSKKDTVLNKGNALDIAKYAAIGYSIAAVIFEIILASKCKLGLWEEIIFLSRLVFVGILVFLYHKYSKNWNIARLIDFIFIVFASYNCIFLSMYTQNHIFPIKYLGLATSYVIMFLAMVNIRNMKVSFKITDQASVEHLLLLGRKKLIGLQFIFLTIAYGLLIGNFFLQRLYVYSFATFLLMIGSLVNNLKLIIYNEQQYGHILKHQVIVTASTLLIVISRYLTAF